MADKRNWHLVMYDISDPKALRRVHKTLKAWGTSIQYSVFAVHTTKTGLEELRFQLALMMDKKTDRLMIVRLCSSCARRVIRRGKDLDEDGLPTEVEPCMIV